MNPQITIVQLPTASPAQPDSVSNPLLSPSSAATPANACDDPATAYPKIYRKYEADRNAIIHSIPAPSITEDALANKDKALGKMILELILAPCGVTNSIVHRGSIEYGLGVRAEQAAKQIQFTPAIKDGVEVPQEFIVEYEFYACPEQGICSRTREVVEGV